jgi:microcystin-dependent protein
MDPFIGEIRLFAGNFAPKDWALCNGQLMAITQNSALFALLGTTYGGDGKTTFALPDLRGRVPINFGTGAGLTPRTLGEVAGSPYVTLLENQIPAHTHQPMAVAVQGASQNPSGNIWAEAVPSGRGGQQAPLYAPTPNATMSPMAVAQAGGSQPHNNMQPYVGLNYIIALTGIFPPRQ